MLKVKGWENKYHVNSNQKRGGVLDQMKSLKKKSGYQRQKKGV